VGRLLASVLFELGAEIACADLGGARGCRGQRANGVAVLAGVHGQLRHGQLSRRPTLVERVLQHVVTVADGFELGPEVH
jgi:hypothetical protein